MRSRIDGSDAAQRLLKRVLEWALAHLAAALMLVGVPVW
jgi:hypothetical protein